MDAKELFFERYDGFREYPDVLLDGMSNAQQRRSPHAAVNPIAWLLWHIARCEDVAVQRLLADRPQVLDDGAWPARLAWDGRHVGTGMTREEVAEFCACVDLPALAAYRAAVTEATEAVVRELPSAALAGKLDVERLKRVFVDEGAGGPAAPSLVEAYAGRTKGWLLGHLALTHQYYHMGQAFQVRAMHGLPTPW
ncbi:DinB family protein [bacterium]|nr:DinB family protein [bacterium]